ncbi:MAG: sigma-70 family RNA polymerase sigma factor [Planctomycetota bacterium]|jgi:RNA polymerase sigma factor (sigma-70 family)|nr:sigma-70 family RNA polymerase sigma factor [Planctomycetota bacterium]
MAAVAGVLAGRAPYSVTSIAGAVAEVRESLPGLLVAARQGNADAFTLLIRTFQAPTYQFILRMVRRAATAEDLSQDVFIRLWQHIGEIESAEMLSAWLRRVAANAVIDHWRKEDARRRRMQVLREHPVARLALRPSSSLETREAMRAVHAALDALPAKLRSVLMLRTQENMSYEEVADVLGMSACAVRSRLFRARQELHRLLRQQKAPEYLARMYQPPKA